MHDLTRAICATTGVLAGTYLGGCTGGDGSPDDAAPTSREPVTTSSTPSSEPEPTTRPAVVSDAQIAVARDDLVARFRHERDAIEIVEVEAVTWPNEALGCPDHERTYDPNPVEGYRIVLQWEDVRYQYHGADGGDPFLCQFLD